MLDYLTKAKMLLLDGKFDDALSLILITEKDNQSKIQNEFEHHILKIQVMIRKGEYEQAIKVIESTLDQYSDDSLSYIDLCLNKIEAMWRLGNLDSALEKANEIERLLEELQIPEADYLKRKASLYYNTGVIFRNNGDLEQSLSFGKQSLNLQQSQNLIQESAYTLNLLGIVYFQKGEYDKALECYNNSLTINQKIGDIQYIAKNLNNLGEIYRFKGNLKKSLDYYQEANEEFLKLGNKQDILHVNHNIGLILQGRGDYEGARQKLLKSLVMNEEVGNDIDKSDTTFHLVSVLIDLNNLERAKSYSDELHDLMLLYPQNKVISLRSLIAKSFILKNSSRKEDIDEAKDLLKAIVNEEIVFHELTVTAMIHLCQILADEVIRNQEINLLEDLNTYTTRLQSLVDEHHSNVMTIEIYILQSRFAIIKGQLQRALRLLEKAHDIAHKQNLNSLTRRLEDEINNFHAEYEKWVSLIQRNAPMYERLEEARITEYVKEAQRLVHLFN
jgi:tetratricopeptide (TPR) repeat protein